MRQIYATFLLAILAVSAFAQTGKVMDNLSVLSKLLKSERKYAIYLPPDYATSERSYPVLYLLHGAGDDHTGWVQFGEVLNITDKAIREGSATPMIIVMPDADTGRRGYFNDVKGDWNYEDFFFQELMPHVEKKFRIKANKRFRAVAGLSMGGGGTFMYALHHPELFSSACPLSASAGPITVEDAKKNLLRNNPDIQDSTVTNYYNRHSALALINNIKDDQKKAVRWYIDCGDDDFLYEGNSLVHIAMKKKEIPHEFRIREGAHNWTYWRESLPKVLEFVSQAFHQY
ncbi:alpha/beta hydrolase-fold protein [Dyadobacter chenwenxiniae]|uniref:Esterase family protein n=1 Tax=Dyadobacter chenwenxiniae TaxID=2906456 RepID=A0A9X1TF79_9BACT|nr:alpha/beta hydrolase-fold protein [Dyadobacter chenwenxiniae]MCF0062350.1 esterase family protein [Dyadobacter chenwenxiniae]UON83894.1 alpha/beta hydrolase-fold protein [Dyadobacter chenwenxiniae]